MWKTLKTGPMIQSALNIHTSTEMFVHTDRQSSPPLFFMRSVVLHIWPWERQRLLILMCKTEPTISDIFQTRMKWIVYYYYYYNLLLNDSYDCFLGLTYATCCIGYFMSVNLWIECSSRKSTLTFRCFSTCFCTRSVDVCAFLSSVFECTLV